MGGFAPFISGLVGGYADVHASKAKQAHETDLQNRGNRVKLIQSMIDSPNFNQEQLPAALSMLDETLSGSGAGASGKPAKAGKGGGLAQLFGGLLPPKPAAVSPLDTSRFMLTPEQMQQRADQQLQHKQSLERAGAIQNTTAMRGVDRQQDTLDDARKRAEESQRITDEMMRLNGGHGGTLEEARYNVTGRRPLASLQTQPQPRPDLQTVGEDGKPITIRYNPDGTEMGRFPRYVAPPAPTNQDDTRTLAYEAFAEKNGLDPAKLNAQQRVQAIQQYNTGTRPPPQVAPASPGGTNNDVKDTADAIVRGDQPPSLQGSYSKGLALRAELGRRGFDLATAQNDWNAIQRHLSTLNGPQQERLRQAITTVQDIVPQIEELYSEWKRVGVASGVKIFNRASLAAAKQLPGQAGAVASTLDALIADLNADLGVVYKGGNSSTDASLELANKNLSADWNELTFKKAIDQIKKNAQIRYNSINNSQPAGLSQGSIYNKQPQGQGQQPPPAAASPGGRGAVSPAAQQYLNSIGVR
jgi:hypothetical protein